MRVPREKVESLLTSLVMSQQSIDRNEQNIRYAAVMWCAISYEQTKCRNGPSEPWHLLPTSWGHCCERSWPDILRGTKEVAEVHAHPEPGNAGITLPLGDHIRE